MGKKRAKLYEVVNPDAPKPEPSESDLKKERKAFAAAARKLVEIQLQQRSERTPRNLTVESGRHKNAERRMAKRAIQNSQDYS